MKYVLTLLLLTNIAFAETSVSGQVTVEEGCAKKVMVWLSLDKQDYKERLLLMHTEVPKGGTFKFYVKPGDYQIRGSDESGCEFYKRITIKGDELNIPVKVVKK